MNRLYTYGKTPPRCGGRKSFRIEILPAPFSLVFLNLNSMIIGPSVVSNSSYLLRNLKS